MAKNKKSKKKSNNKALNKNINHNNPGIDFDEDGKVLEDAINVSEATIDSVWAILQLRVIENTIKYDMISNILRDYTSKKTTGSYRGVNYWSVKAWKKFEELKEKHNYKLSDYTAILGKHFVHEHILPVAAGARLFRSDVPFDRNYVAFVLNNYVVAAVITDKENKKLNKKYQQTMPDSFYKSGNIFERYIPFGIELLYIAWGEGNKEIKGKPRSVDLTKDVFENEFNIAMDVWSDQANDSAMEMIDLMMAITNMMGPKPK